MFYNFLALPVSALEFRELVCMHLFGRGRGAEGWEVNKVHSVLGENGYISEIQNAIRSLFQRKTKRKHFLKRKKQLIMIV